MATEIITTYSARLEALTLVYWLSARNDVYTAGSDNVTVITDRSGNNTDFANAVVGGGAADYVDQAGTVPAHYLFNPAEIDAYGHATGISAGTSFWMVWIGNTIADAMLLSTAGSSQWIRDYTNQISFHDGGTETLGPHTIDPSTVGVFQIQHTAGTTSYWADTAATYTARTLRKLNEINDPPGGAWTRLGYWGAGGTNFWSGRLAEMWYTSQMPASDAAADAIIIDALQEMGTLPPDPEGGDGKRYRGYYKRLRGRETR